MEATSDAAREVVQLLHDPKFFDWMYYHQVSDRSFRSSLHIFTMILVFHQHCANQTIFALADSTDYTILVLLLELFITLQKEHDVTYSYMTLCHKPLGFFNKRRDNTGKPFLEPNFKDITIVLNNTLQVRFKFQGFSWTPIVIVSEYQLTWGQDIRNLIAFLLPI